MSVSEDVWLKKLLRRGYDVAWATLIASQIERGERDLNLAEDLTCGDEGVRKAAKERLEILKGLK